MEAGETPEPCRLASKMTERNTNEQRDMVLMELGSSTLEVGKDTLCH